MTYDFDTPVGRRGTQSVKWDETPEGVRPLWVADMDFKTAPCIIDALRRRVEHGVFGYSFPGKDYFDALTGWFRTRHGWTIDPSTVIYTTGVVPALSAIIKGLLKPGDGVIVQTPAYNCFFSSVRNNGCRMLEAPLTYHPDGYTIDFDDLEQIAARPEAKMLLLCNPHNPVGRVWTRRELEMVADICRRNNLIVLSDEIHCELTFNGIEYTPFQTLDHEVALRSVACISPSKAFNIAGLQTANIVCPDLEMRSLIDRAINDNEVCDIGPFGITALTAAYTHGADWLDALRQYLWRNFLTVSDFLKRNLPDYSVQPLQGTYLVWINCEKTGLTSDELVERLIEQQQLRLSPGSIYGEAGRYFLRLNIACPREALEQSLVKLGAFFAQF